MADGVPFVGYRIFYDHILIRGNTLQRIERNYRSKKRQLRNGTLSGQKLAETEASIIGHLKHANTFGLTKKIFEDDTVIVLVHFPQFYYYDCM